MKNIGVFVSENFQFLETKFSMYLNRRVFLMGLMKKSPLGIHDGLTNFILKDG